MRLAPLRTIEISSPRALSDSDVSGIVSDAMRGAGYRLEMSDRIGDRDTGRTTNWIRDRSTPATILSNRAARVRVLLRNSAGNALVSITPLRSLGQGLALVLSMATGFAAMAFVLLEVTDNDATTHLALDILAVFGWMTIHAFGLNRMLTGGFTNEALVQEFSRVCKSYRVNMTARNDRRLSIEAILVVSAVACIAISVALLLPDWENPLVAVAVAVGMLTLVVFLFLIAHVFRQQGAPERTVAPALAIYGPISVTTATCWMWLVPTLSLLTRSRNESENLHHVSAVWLVSGLAMLLLCGVVALSQLLGARSYDRHRKDVIRRTTDPLVKHVSTGEGYIGRLRLYWAGATVALGSAALVSALCAMLLLGGLLSGLMPVSLLHIVHGPRGLLSSFSTGEYVLFVVLCIIGLAVTLTPWLLSVRGWLKRMRVHQQGSLAARLAYADEYNLVRRELEDVCPASATPPDLVLTEPGSGTVCAYRVPASRRCAIAFDPRLAQGVLEPNQRRALLAHEMAHIRYGDCHRMARLRALAHLLWLGDLFVGLWMDSVRMEHRADDYAVLRVGIDAADLESALDDLASWKSTGSRGHSSGIPAVARIDDVSPEQLGPSAANAATRGRAASIREWLSLWYKMYFSGGTLDYWHPNHEERLARLRAMRQEAGGAELEA